MSKDQQTREDPTVDDTPRSQTALPLDVVRRRQAAVLLVLLGLALVVVAVVHSGGGSTVAAPGLPGGPKLAPGSASASVQVAEVVDPVKVTVSSGGMNQELTMVGLAVATVQGPGGATPCYSNEALAKARKLLTGETVAMVTDPVQIAENGEGRMPAYLVLSDGRFYDKVMVEEGFLRAVDGPPGYQDQKDLLEAEQKARKDKKGLWSIPGCGQ